jgi:glycosyltransferase involved in cell wall biosynthesis
MAKAGAVGRIAALKASSQPKTIHTFHGHVLEGYFGRRIERAFVAVERGLARRTDVLVAISDEVRDSLLYRGIGKPGQWRVIPLGFDLDPFLHVSTPTMELRNSLGVRRDTPLIGVIGRLAPVKDHATLLEALEHLPGVHLAILGDGESRASIERRIKSGSLQGRVHMVGWWLDIADALADLDVVVLSSINEGTPVSLIEALASARPVVATDVGGVRSVVDDGDTGFLVGGADPRALAAEVQRLLSDRDLRAAFGERGRQAMVDRFSKTRLLSDIRTLYEELSS